MNNRLIYLLLLAGLLVAGMSTIVYAEPMEEEEMLQARPNPMEKNSSTSTSAPAMKNQNQTMQQTQQMR